MDTRQVVARFEAERQALAMMDHPNIAKVLDAGETNTGLPYFVMELVRGLPITKYCDAQRLNPKQRLQLFIPICQAIQHAHQKGIIHRDLKPSNVLVALYDGKPVPKVIDFGIAKATGQKLTEKTLFTQYGQIIGTLEYMSPEQAELNQLDVDTRSDIYSLGVLLYELLTGQTPFDRARLRSAGFAEMLRIIREEDPPLPSTRLRDSDELPAIADNRRLPPAKLGSLVNGELDWIVMKSLDKNRTRRYETANSLADDVRHYLNDEPVLACRPSSVYRFRKFARRNKVVMLTTAIVAVSLIAGLVGTSWQAIRATAAENKTAEEAAIAKSVNEFLNTDLLGAADPHAEPDRDLKVREVLDRAAQNIPSRFADQPLVEAAIRTTIGSSYSALGQHDEAEPHLERAQQLRRQVLGDDDPQTLDAGLSLTWLAHDRGQYQQAHARLEEIAERCQRILGDESLTTIRALEQLGDMKRHLGQYDEAQSLADKVIELRRRIQGPEHPDTLTSMSYLAKSYKHAGQLQKALPVLEQTFDLRREVLGPEHPSTLISMGNLVEAYTKAAQYDRAIELGQQCLELKRKILGREHPHTLISIVNLADAYQVAGQHDQSIQLYEPTLDLMRQILGPEHPHTLTLINNLAAAYHSAGQYENALELYEQTLELNPKVRGLEHPITLRTMNNRVVLTSFFFFLTGLRQVHNACHYMMGIPGWACDLVLFVLSVLMLSAMHAVQVTHMHHHRHCLDDHDIEAATAKISGWRALLLGPMHPVRLHYWGFRLGRFNKRCWIIAEVFVILASLVLVFFVLDNLALKCFAIVMAIGECCTGFFAVWTVHHDCDKAHVARTQRGWLKNLVSYNMFYHLEHHLFPSVPTCHLPELAERLDRVAPELRSKTVF